MITYSTFQSSINDGMKDTYFCSNHVDEMLRATNHALNDINVGEIGEPLVNQEVGYDFQRQLLSPVIPYVVGTTDYNFVVTNFKFADDLRVHTNQNVSFEEVTPKYFHRKKGVFLSSEKMFCFEYNGNTLTVKINHSVAENLDLDYFSTDIALDADSTTRKLKIEADGDSFLIPDRYIETLLELTLAYLYYQLKGFNSEDYIFHLKEGRSRLKRMISAIGHYRKHPIERFMIHSEIPGSFHKLTTT